MTAESMRTTLERWRASELLAVYPGLRFVAVTGKGVKIAGLFSLDAQQQGLERIADEYRLEITVPMRFPQAIPTVRETEGRIPDDYHKLADGSLCLGSPTRLRIQLASTPTLLGFVQTCVVPYLYARAYYKKHGIMPFGELDHGRDGIRQDLASLFGMTATDRVEEFLVLAALKKRRANKRICPCQSGRRLGRCHNPAVNRLRVLLGRLWFRSVYRTLRPSL